jgi:hypothetical protein
MHRDFDKLVRLLDKELDVAAQLDVFRHIDECETCGDVIYEISRDGIRTFSAIGRTMML